MFCNIDMNITGEGVRIKLLRDKTYTTIINMRQPVILELWHITKGYTLIKGAYNQVLRDDNFIVGYAYIKDDSSGIEISLEDRWSVKDSVSVCVSRRVQVQHGSAGYGVRTGMDFELFPEEYTDFQQLQYFAPPAIYDKNDLDQDGVDDYFLTQNRIIRDDRLNTLSFMVYHPEKHLDITLIRSDLPEYDDYPERPNKETTFLQRTDVGSMGIWQGSQGMELRTRYPFYEGPTSLALFSKDKKPWEAYWPANDEESFEMSYELKIRENKSFIDGMWCTYSDRLKSLRPEKVELSVSADLLTRYRTYAVDCYYMEKSKEEDSNEPAGYVLNCHPQDGKQLCDIIQYGFTGQNTISAYCSIRQGYTDGNEKLILHGRKTLDFFSDRIHIPESGIFYNLYNMEKAQFDFWWTGLILPLSYAEGKKLEELMGPLYEYYKDLLPILKEKQGSYLRCMNEEAYGLIYAYGFEHRMGVEHKNWLDTSIRYGDFLVRVQGEDGTWCRAYEKTGIPITEPTIWFGKNDIERKGCTSTAIPFLVELYRQTRIKKYLDAAVKAGKYVAGVSIDQVRCCGGIHDSIFEKGVLVDNESTLYAMLAMYELYKETKDNYYLEALRKAAVLFTSWIYLWDIPLPTGSTLKTMGFRTTGLGSCDVPSAGYVHTFENRGVAVLIDLAFMTGEKEFLELAELIWHGCNQTVSVPGKTWGYSVYGLQEEGWLVNWFMADDPIFNDNSSFGHRWKGEGNKTCYPWISAVALMSYWNMKDTYGSADFLDINKTYKEMVERSNKE